MTIRSPRFRRSAGRFELDDRNADLIAGRTLQTERAPIVELARRVDENGFSSLREKAVGHHLMNDCWVNAILVLRIDHQSSARKWEKCVDEVRAVPVGFALVHEWMLLANGKPGVPKSSHDCALEE
ncbi:MAG: hypothetical protein QM817_25470 [Archangium sp.]